MIRMVKAAVVLTAVSASALVVTPVVDAAVPREGGGSCAQVWNSGQYGFANGCKTSGNAYVRVHATCNGMSHDAYSSWASGTNFILQTEKCDWGWDANNAWVEVSVQ
jgi:hypothetical protein